MLFKERKSRFRLDEIRTTKPHIIEALIIMAAISVMISRVIVGELHKLEAKRRETADADSSQSASRNPNPHRQRLHREVESDEFAFDRH